MKSCCMLQTDSNISVTVCRLTLALVFLPHGLQLAFGWFGGPGFSAAMALFTDNLGLPVIVSLLVIMAQFVCGLALALGLASRFCAASLIIVMVGAIFITESEHGFFMSLLRARNGQGFEYHLLAIGLALSVVISGGGRFSVDRLLGQGSCQEKTTGATKAKKAPTK